MQAAFSRVLETDARNPVALMGLGSAQWLQGRLDDAMNNYNKAMKQPGLPNTGWSDIARLEIQRQMQRDKGQRDFKAAEEALEKAGQPSADGVPVSAARLHELTLLKTELL